MSLRFNYNAVRMEIMHSMTTTFCAFKSIRDNMMSIVVSKYFYRGMSGLWHSIGWVSRVGFCAPNTWRVRVGSGVCFTPKHNCKLTQSSFVYGNIHIPVLKVSRMMLFTCCLRFLNNGSKHAVLQSLQCDVALWKKIIIIKNWNLWHIITKSRRTESQ